MNVAALAIPLTGLFALTNLGAAATAGGFRFVLNTSTNGQPLFTGEMTLLLIVFAHGSGFPLAHSAPHQLWAVGFQHTRLRRRCRALLRLCGRSTGQTHGLGAVRGV